MASDDEHGTRQNPGGVTGSTAPSDTAQTKPKAGQTLDSIREEWRWRLMLNLYLFGFVVFAFGLELPRAMTLIALGLSGILTYRMWRHVNAGILEFGARPCPSHKPPWATDTIMAGSDPRSVAFGCLQYWVLWIGGTWAVTTALMIGTTFSGLGESGWRLLAIGAVGVWGITTARSVRNTLPLDQRRIGRWI